MAKEKMMHAVVCAFPGLGHIHPLLRLSFLLVEQGINVTFVSTQFFIDRLRMRHGKRQTLKSAAAATRSKRQRRAEECGVGKGSSRGEQEQGMMLDEEVPVTEGCISFEGLPDGLPAQFDRISPSTQLSRAVEQLGPAFDKLMRSLLRSTSPASTLAISDAFLSWAHDVALALLIPSILFWPMSTSVFTIFGNTDRLLESGINPFLEDLDTIPARVVDFLPGLPALPTSHLPYRVKSAEGQDRRFLLCENLARQSVRCREASNILINSADWLESLPMDLQRNIAVPMTLVGPLVSLPYLEGQPSDFVQTVEVESVIEWLNTKLDSSVLYVCLGSVVSWTRLQMEEVSLGLMAKKQAFLWVVRPWEMRQFLPHGVLSLGKVVEFAPQIQVLGHRAIGGFLSHCGWNSTLESLSMGVPILAWPHFLDQFTNCWYVVQVWQVGVELGVVRRGGIEDAAIDRDHFTRAVTMVMEGESGRLMRLRASNLKKSLQECLQKSSSHANLKAILSKVVAERVTT